MSILWFWLNLYSVNLCQATAVGPKKDKTTTKKPVHYDDDVLKVYYLKHIKDKFYFKKQKKSVSNCFPVIYFYHSKGIY